ncbi:MAG: penicillin-binding protein 2 [Candidatus Omnitrophica bacterium]|nr:penicillin-binding protein 2 [Candidatus Omnitrophota bacterium]
MRIKIIRLAIIGLFVLIAVDLIYVQVIRGQYFYHLSTNNRIRIVPLEGWRGRIEDRNGKILADRRVSYNVMVAPQDLLDQQELFRYLAKVLSVDQKKIEETYAQKKHALFAPVVVAEDIGRDKAIILEENKYLYPSLIVQEGFRRSYPLGKNSAHVLGYVGKINRVQKEKFKEYGYSPQSMIGYSGVEEYYDAYLKGEEGGLQIEVNSRGQQVQLLSLKEPATGQDIRLTIDSDIQQIAMDVLEGKTGVIIVMDMANGEVLGMTSVPAYDPNVFVDVKEQSQIARLFNNSSAPLLNRAIKGLFPPGSVFKVPVAIGGLDSRKITMHTTYHCDGSYEVGGMTFRCTHAHGPENLIESLAHSCNIYYYRLGLVLGADMIQQYARQLGLGSLTHIDLPYEESGHVPSRRQRSLRKKEQWYTGDTLNLSIGQGGLLVTPMQMIRMMATVANSGMELQPHVIKAIGGITVDQYDLKGDIKISREALETVQKGMREAVTNYSGTAHALDLPELYVAGKTGTAQTSGDQLSHAWFVGYAKGEARNIAFCVFLEHGDSSQNACLAARELLLGMQAKDLL